MLEERQDTRVCLWVVSHSSEAASALSCVTWHHGSAALNTCRLPSAGLPSLHLLLFLYIRLAEITKKLDIMSRQPQNVILFRLYFTRYWRAMSQWLPYCFWIDHIYGCGYESLLLVFTLFQCWLSSFVWEVIFTYDLLFIFKKKQVFTCLKTSYSFEDEKIGIENV